MEKGGTGAENLTVPSNLQVTKAKRQVVHPTAYWETLVHLLKGNVGAGLFAMGYAYKNAGLIGGLIGTLFIGGVCIYCSHLLLWASSQIREKLKMDAVPSFEETVEYCFMYGPACYRRNSKFAAVSVNVFIIVTQLGFCCVFFVFVSESFDLVLSESIGINWPSEIYTMIMYCLMIVVCSIPHLKFLTPVSLLGTICLFFGIVSILIISSLDLASISERPAFASVTTWPLFFGGVVYAFEGIALIIPLKSEMKNPDNFAKKWGVFNVGMAIVMTLFNSVGFVGYLRYGEKVKGSVSLNLEPTTYTHIVKIVVALGIAFSFPIQFFVAATIICNLATNRIESSAIKKSLVSILVRVALVTFTCLVAIFVPNLGIFISLIGAVSSTALALVFPVLCHIALVTCPPEIRPLRSKWLPVLYTMDAIALVLAVCGFATGTFFSVRDLVRHFRWSLFSKESVKT